MAALCRAKLQIAVVPLRYWRGSVGGRQSPPSDRVDAENGLKSGRSIAQQVMWAAHKLPFQTTCLSHAMALSWLLRRRSIRHVVVFAARPAGQRAETDALHAWVEVGGKRIIGDLPGPWLETLRLGSP